MVSECHKTEQIGQNSLYNQVLTRHTDELT